MRLKLVRVDAVALHEHAFGPADSVASCEPDLTCSAFSQLPRAGVSSTLGSTRRTPAGPGQPGVSTQSVTDIPAGTYVALATRGTENVDPANLWISDYPGLSEVLATVPWTAHTVQQASPIVTIDESSPVPPDLGSLAGTGSAG